MSKAAYKRNRKRKETPMSLPKVSPSRLDRLATCPRYVFDDRDTKAQEARQEAMDSGTSFHEVLERVAKAQNPAIEIGQIPDFSSRRCAEFAWSAVAGIISAGASISGVEVEFPESSVCRRGRADLVLKYDNTAVIVDWKLVRSVSNYELQLIGYAISAFESDPAVEYVRTLVVSPAIEHVEDVTYARTDLDSMRRKITDLMELVQNPFVPGRPGDACPGCRWSGACPAQCHELVPISVGAAMPVAFADLLSPATPEGRARRRYVSDWLLSCIDGIKADDLTWVQAGNAPPPGYKLVTMPGRTSIPAEATPQAITKLIGGGYSLDAIQGACTLNLGKLAASLAPVLGEDEKELKKRMADLVGELAITGQPSQHLRKTSKKALADLFKDVGQPKQIA